MRRIIAGAAAAAALNLVLATSALAFDCTNASKGDPAAGAQLVIDINTGAIVSVTEGLAKRIDQGLADPATGARFHGLVGLDFDSEGEADVSTWVGVGPTAPRFLAAPAPVPDPRSRQLDPFVVTDPPCHGHRRP